jgi:hypothetical protein
MGMESFGTPAPLSEKEQKIKDIDERIAAKKEEWRKAEERNYELRNNFSANTEGKPVDFVELNKGDVSERDKYNAYKEGERATKAQMDNIQAEIDTLEAERTSLF